MSGAIHTAAARRRGVDGQPESTQTSGVRDTIEAAGLTLRYLLLHSSDFNPIEPMRSKVKGKLRSSGAPSVDAVHDAIGIAMATITVNDGLGFFRGCGYAAT